MRRKLVITGPVAGALAALVVLYLVTEPVAFVVVILLVAGVGLEFLGLWTLWLDLQEVETTVPRIKGESGASRVRRRLFWLVSAFLVVQ